MVKEREHFLNLELVCLSGIVSNAGYVFIICTESYISSTVADSATLCVERGVYSFSICYTC